MKGKMVSGYYNYLSGNFIENEVNSKKIFVNQDLKVEITFVWKHQFSPTFITKDAFDQGSY